MCLSFVTENESALSLSAAIASDRLAGSPLMKHLQRNNDHKGIKHLQFWEDVQRYLVPTAVIGARNKYRMAKTLILTYLEPGSPRQIMLAPRMRRELLRLLPVDQADALLFKTAKHAVKVSKFVNASVDGKLWIKKGFKKFKIL